MNKSLVAKIRKSKSLTQENLAEKAHVTVRTIQRIEAGEDVSSETLRSVSNALDVTVSELFESVESHEKEIELMEYSQEQQRQLNQRKYEMNAIRLVAWGFAFMILAISFLYVDNDDVVTKSIRLFVWIFFLCLLIGGLNYFINVFISKKLDTKYPMTIGLSSKRNKQNEPIQNVWQLLELLAKRWWLIFPIGGFLSWLIPHLMGK